VVGAFGGLALYAFVDPRILAVAAAIALGQRAFAYRSRQLRQRVEAAAFARARELGAVARVAELLRQQHFSDPHLTGLQASIASQGRPASRHIHHLERLVAWLESRRNQLFAVFAWALLLPEQLCFAIEAWRARHGAAAVRWLGAIGEIEALCSLATFAFEHPDYAWPELEAATEPPRLCATALGHPLLPAATRVSNDLALDQTHRLLVVTGSNMSGKSTLLRTVGVNVVLAQAGGPVCATALRLTPLAVGASMRAEDSLEQGVSRFFAEIKRLHDILSLTAQERPVLFLLDEILNGTNSIDRRDGAAAVVGRLLERGAIGLLTTHDLALADLADAPATHGANIHFQDTLEGDRLVFDYRIRPGVVTRRNALDLMRLVGIDVPSKPPAG
jgi:DNA mismatch repair ATPase MutS